MGLAEGATKRERGTGGEITNFKKVSWRDREEKKTKEVRNKEWNESLDEPLLTFLV